MSYAWLGGSYAVLFQAYYNNLFHVYYAIVPDAHYDSQAVTAVHAAAGAGWSAMKVFAHSTPGSVIIQQMCEHGEDWSEAARGSKAAMAESHSNRPVG